MPKFVWYTLATWLACLHSLHGVARAQHDSVTDPIFSLESLYEYSGENETDAQNEKRIKIATGASRSRAGWHVSHDRSSDLRALFKVNLKHCHVDRLEETALAVSTPKSPRYGRYLSSRDVCEIIACPDRDEAVGRVLHWLLGEVSSDIASAQGTWNAKGKEDDVLVKVHCSHISVSMSAAEADKAFPEAAFRSHRRIADTRNGQKRGGSSAVLRATGDILIPQSVSEHVEFISGLTELWVTDGAGGGMGKLNGAGAGRVGSVGDAGSVDFTEVMIQPRTLRALYNVPEGERGGWARRGNNRQGVAAFDGYYTTSDLCAAHNLLAPDSDWLNRPEVDYQGPGFDPSADEAESDLDTQYMTLMGPGVPVTFSNHADGQWILDWAKEVVDGELSPEKGGPLVWSISYGFPEEWQCLLVQDDSCVGGLHGYDPAVYLREANVELAKIVALGVSVLVSSGDDGAGQFATCPVDANMPVDVSGGAMEGWTRTCPFEDESDCNCASFVLELQPNVTETTRATNTSRCILPVGLAIAAMGIDTHGTNCVEVLADPGCRDLLDQLQDTSVLSAADDEGACRTVAEGNFSIYSDCQCEDIPEMVQDSCSLKGYTFEEGRDGLSPFAPSFPASSQWVTSIGATQIEWDLAGSCLQSDLLGPSNVLNAETAVNKFTGGFDGGGGFSNYFPASDYQRKHVDGYISSDAAPPSGTFNKSNRGFPDISAAGHNFVVVVGGAVQQIGGTSASAPALAGMVSLLNERLLAAGKPQLGFLNPTLYKAAEDKPSVFQPVLPKTYDLTGHPLEEILGPTYKVGSNRCNRYSCCEIGYDGSEDGTWDPVTGLGTINYEALADYLNIPPSPQRPPPRGRDRHHAAYVAWIVVLVFGFASAVLFLVYEHRPKLVLSATSLGRSMRNMGGTGGGNSGVSDGQGSKGFDEDEHDGVGWRGGFGRRGGRSRGALTEMVMESEIGVGGGEAAYRLLEDDTLEGEEEQEEDRGGRSGRRSV